jgi:hypothetical protein
MESGLGRFRRSRVRPWLLTSLLLIGICGLHSSLAWGQLTSGSLTGVVSDPSAAVIPGAKVVFTDADKAYDYPGTTDGAGRYLITNLPPSTYEIHVGAPGFKAHTQSGIILNVGTRISEMSAWKLRLLLSPRKSLEPRRCLPRRTQ